ncbi:glutathione S-transferase N-terminal domain-containing protein, partial [Acinetobacter baumannii]
QSERIVWLCEELGLDYELKHYTRDPGTILSPPELKALHPLGAAPVIEDAVITGHDRDEICVLIFPNVQGRRGLCPHLAADAPLAALIA